MRTQWFLWWRRPARTQTGSAVLLNVGRGGETIRSICKASGAKITCDKESEGTLLLSRLIKISGTQKEVAAAKASSRRNGVTSQNQASRSFRPGSRWLATQLPSLPLFSTALDTRESFRGRRTSQENCSFCRNQSPTQAADQRETRGRGRAGRSRRASFMAKRRGQDAAGFTPGGSSPQRGRRRGRPGARRRFLGDTQQ